MLVRDRIRVLGLVGTVFAGCVLALDAGCAHANTDVAPAEVVTVAPPPAPVEAEAPPPPAPVAKKEAVNAAEPPPDESMFPPAWRSPPPPTTSFADEATAARGLHARMHAMSQPARIPKAAADGGTDPAALAWLSKLLELRERADRAYAGAFVAQDATPEGRVEVLFEATTLAQELQATRGAAGYQEIPGVWKADPALHATFEDIANGPVRRLGDEARALAVFCVSAAEREHVRGHAADACRMMAGGNVKVNAEGGKACACAKGDPLCTTTDWCR